MYTLTSVRRGEYYCTASVYLMAEDANVLVFKDMDMVAGGPFYVGLKDSDTRLIGL